MRYYYMVLKHYEPTENNPCQSDDTQDWLYGKAGFLWNKSRDGIPARWWWENHAYTRRCDARRTMNKEAEWCKKESARGMWKASVRLAEFPVAEKEGEDLVSC